MDDSDSDLKTELIFANKAFQRFCKKEKLSNDKLLDVIAEADQGLINADLGGNVIKQRIARTGQGKSGGYRSIIVFKKGDKAFFVHGFAKNESDNITPKELKTLKELAKKLLGSDEKTIALQLKSGDLIEVKRNDQTV